VFADACFFKKTKKIFYQLNMRTRIPRSLIFLTTLLCSTIGIAQPTYYMSNQTVDDCEGFFLDSEQGDPGSNYDHNENYIFRICIPGADRIFMEFNEFCTEEDFDYFRIFDGPDTLSQLIGHYTGEPDPPFIVATSGCLTFHFFSDVSVSCTGWNARWWTEFDEPVPPDILPIPDLTCESQSLTFTFAEALPCDSLYLSAFSILGPQTPAITSVDPGACSGGTTTTVTLHFAEPLTASGNYQVRYRLYRLNSCDIPRELYSTEPFGIYDCPLFVQIEGSGDPLCAGSCQELTAEAFGGDPNTYSYTWTPAFPDSATILACPEVATTYSVIVSDGQGATAEAEITLTPFPLPSINSDDLTICQSDPPFLLSASPPGGQWLGNGISDEQSGEYDPAQAMVAQDTVYYIDPTNACMTSLLITINELDVGNADASCPGAAPFYVSGGEPAGGVWSGMHIQADGLFDPVAIGSFEVTYTHPNGCIGSKMVNVGEIVFPSLDSLCQSEESFLIAVTPFGGEWFGEGITDVDEGRFDPGLAGEGSHELIYRINGCEDTLVLHVKGIDAGSDLYACPEQSPFIIPGDWYPAGGVWRGVGIIDSVSGLYDPSLLSDGENDSLYFWGNGCSDLRVVYIRQTNIEMDTLSVCENEESVSLDYETIGLVPEGGRWSGPGLQGALDGTGAPWEFIPRLAGPGIHLLIYDANTCLDSLWVMVFPAPQLEADTLCTEDPATRLIVNLNGGLWQGLGIVNRQAGIFDPALAGAGLHEVTYRSEDGCLSTTEVIVVPPPGEVLDSLPDFFCFKDSVILSLASATDEILIDGEVYDQFNPALLSPGEHTLVFRGGVGECFTEAQKQITIGEPITLTLPFARDSICFGLSLFLEVEAGGGLEGSELIYNWDQGLGFGAAHQVQPETTTTYTLTVSDGCSDPGVGRLTVFVHEEIQAGYRPGPKVCQEDTTFAQVFASPAADYEFVWNTDPPTYGDFLESQPATYEVETIDLQSGCSVKTEVRLPGFTPVKANFGFSPNVECLSSLETEVELLDFSVGGISGYWDFGDESPQVPYDLGSFLTHTFPDTAGSYLVALYLINEGQCESSYELEICVDSDARLFAPNAFTPNYDGSNDEFHFKGVGIEQLEYQVFNRWGEMIFEGQGMEDAWDGQFKGRPVMAGVYTYVARYHTIHSRKKQVKKGVITVVY